MRSAFLLRIFGLLLFTSAGFKLHGLGVSPVSRIGLFADPAFVIALADIEVLLALWFVSGKHIPAGWVSAVVLFSVFASISFAQGMNGQASCGCLGRIHVSPWLACAFDVGALAALTLVRPECLSFAEVMGSLKQTLRTLLWVACGVFGFTGAVLGVCLFVFGSLDATVAHLRGELVSVHPRLVDAGQAFSGEVRKTKIVLTNHLPQPMTIFGGTSD
jgi:hypothetical protein